MDLFSFDAVKISLASPEKIRKWSYGEVKKPDTINYRTLKPESDGIFCEKIFGPVKDWECHCGKYKNVRYKGIVCDKCGVEITTSKVRRERMGHIELAAPVAHIWYYKNVPNYMSLILDIPPRHLELVIYYGAYVVIDPGDVPVLSKKQVLLEEEYRELKREYGNRFKVGMGAEAIKELLKEINLDELSKELRQELETAGEQEKLKIKKRLEVVEAFRKSGNKPEWMILDVIPVLPPDLRPLIQLDGGRFATSDLNDLYRRVININNRLRKFIENKAPEIILRNEKRLLQAAVDALIDNGRRGRPVTGAGNKPLKSLSDMLKGKQGRFRQNLLGKRVDYSGRSVIVVGPDLKIYQCGLPKEMALELFRPFVVEKLIKNKICNNPRTANKLIDRQVNEVWDALEEVIKDHPVLLNRAPTLHRLGIQAFEPVLVEGKAIRLHPLVCTAYNADFDGDQMAVHVPLSAEAQAEARFLMLSANNLFKPADGKPIVVPTQDMVLGIYYLSLEKEGDVGEGKIFASEDEALLAYEHKVVGLHARIKVRRTAEKDGKIISGLVETTVGKIILNQVIPQDLGFVDRSKNENLLKYEIDMVVDKKTLGKIIDRCIKVHGTTKTAEILDKIKELGFKFSTKGAMTISVSDMVIPEVKQKLIKEAEQKVENIKKLYMYGLISDEERYEQVISVWNTTKEKLTEELIQSLDKFNPIFMMANSGARGSKSQISQLAGMRGLMANTSGKPIEIPIKSNFREGLNVLEFFISTHGARKGLVDTALRTADSGYLTRRLVDVAQDVIVREEDCGTDKGIWVEEIKDGTEIIETLEERITGRYAATDIVHPQTQEFIVRKNELITEEIAKRIVKAGIKSVYVRSVLECKTRHGVCAKCYGLDLGTGRPVNVGEAVGIIAAQSIGEPGTQLTMRTFHTGGIAGQDITQGLPRVEELFEARIPKGTATISEIEGYVSINEDNDDKKTITVHNDNGEKKTYVVPYSTRLKVNDGDYVKAGDSLTEGSINPHDLLRIKGPREVQNYLLAEVQKVYKTQGVDINDKHIEIIIRQMMKKVKVEDPGDTNLLPGEIVERYRFEDENDKAIATGKRPALGRRVLLGITKAALSTESFLSAASFQETTRVLTDAAIKGKVDPLIGIKENVIIGRLIPAGTGTAKYRNVVVLQNNTDSKI